MWRAGTRRARAAAIVTVMAAMMGCGSSSSESPWPVEPLDREPGPVGEHGGPEGRRGGAAAGGGAATTVGATVAAEGGADGAAP